MRKHYHISTDNMATITKVVVSYDDGTTQELDAAAVVAAISPVAVTVEVQAGATPTATVTTVANG